MIHKKTVSIHQPNYLPWPGFFYKIANSDIFVVFDDVQFPRGKKNNFANRNRIKTQGGSKWLTIPVQERSSMKLLNEIKINNELNWKEDHWNSLKSNYSQSNFFSLFEKSFHQIYQKDWNFLIDFSVELIQIIMKILKINTKIVFSSKLKVDQTGTEKLLEIIQKTECNRYLTGTGPGSIKYLEGKEELFFNENIEISFENYKQIEYSQLFGDFIPNLSICDMIFNIGSEKTMSYILKK
jgi:hypothetical protein